MFGHSTPPGFGFFPSLLLRSFSRSLWRGLLAAQDQHQSGDRCAH